MSAPSLRAVPTQEISVARVAADARRAETAAHDLASRLESLADEIISLIGQITAAASKPTGAQSVMLTPEEAAESLRVSRTVVFTLIKSGTLRSVRIGNSRRIPTAALADYAESLSKE
jgi:excisionase family DNA binding protein